LVLASASCENVALERYGEIIGSRCCTICFAIPGNSLLHRDQNSKTVAHLKVSFRFLSAARSVSCSTVGPRTGMDGCEKFRPHRDWIPGPSNPQPEAIPTELSRPTFCLWKAKDKSSSDKDMGKKAYCVTGRPLDGH
jgi:hypothetical protein